MRLFGFGKSGHSKGDSAVQANLEDPDQPITAEMLLELIGSRSHSGISVSPDTAMRCGAVFAAVRLLSSTISTLPLKVYRQEDERVRVSASDHKYANMVRFKPNEDLNSINWRDMLMHFVLLRGDNINVMRYRRSGDFYSILPVHSDSVTVERKAGRVVYLIQLKNGSREEYSREEVLHFAGPGFDGLRGMSPLKAYKESVGISTAAEQHSASFYKNGTNLGGLLVKKGNVLTKDQKDAVKQAWNEYKGREKAHGTGILPAEFEYIKLGMSAEDAELIATRKFQVTDIARIFQVPPHMIGDMEKATFSNIEHQNINFVQYSVAHWLQRIEMEINEKLFGFGDHYAEFSVKGLLRGDLKNQTDHYYKSINGGWQTQNEVRAMENLPPLDGGDELRVPSNTMPADTEIEEKSNEG